MIVHPKQGETMRQQDTQQLLILLNSYDQSQYLQQIESYDNHAFQIHYNSFVDINNSMRLYQDIFSGAELISDSYPSTQIYEGVGLEVKSEMLVKNEDQVDIGCGNAFDAPAEKAEEDQGAPPEKINNILDTFCYTQDQNMDKAFFSKYIKEYMKKILAHLQAKKPDRVDKFKAGAKELVSFIMNNFDEFTFYSKDCDFDNMIVASYFKNKTDQAPYFIYFLDGLKSIKC